MRHDVAGAVPAVTCTLRPEFVCSAYDRGTKSVGTNSILPTVSEQDLLSKIDVFVVLLCT